ncbi:MAG: ABC transporter permease [Enterococcus gilvus]
MIRSIFAERYKKVLLAACLLVIGVGVFNVVIENNQWKSVYNDPHGKENFEKHRHEITYWDDEKEDNVPFSSYKEYQNAQLIFYRSYESYPKIVTASDYSKAVPYQSNFATYFNSALLLIVPLMGFLLFFVDQKTGFNQFLFSLGTSRKDLFRKKIQFVAAPFLLATLVGQFLYALLIHTLIPAPYMNATLGQLFTSVLSNFSLLFFLFCASAFIGSMVGNAFFGPLTFVVFLFLRSWLPNAIYSFGDILTLWRGTFDDPLPRTLFVDSVGKTGGDLLVNLMMIALGFLLLLWAYRKYQTLSLENDNAYLLHKESRWPIWAIMTLFTSFILSLNVFNPWIIYLNNRINHIESSIKLPIVSNILVFLIVGCICALVVFFQEVTSRSVKTLEKVAHRKG